MHIFLFVTVSKLSIFFLLGVGWKVFVVLSFTTGVEIEGGALSCCTSQPQKKAFKLTNLAVTTFPGLGIM